MRELYPNAPHAARAPLFTSHSMSMNSNDSSSATDLVADYIFSRSDAEIRSVD
jgi:hypothetical protein